jgi:hypothetical protein
MVMDKRRVVMEEAFDMLELKNGKDLETMEQKMEAEVNPYKMDKGWVVALLNSWFNNQYFIVNFHHLTLLSEGTTFSSSSSLDTCI